LVSLREEPREDVQVRGVASVQVFEQETPAHVRVPRVPEDGDRVGVVRRQRDLAVGPGRMALDEVLRKSIELARRVDVDRADVFADDPIEVLADRRDLVPQRLYPGAR